MLIQRVVIQGFKTFATRTEFIFDPGVTALVGPNGSGKSNVVDAIRWCLGEQSFSLLRSKKTSDVIFSGSDHKARLGMAEVNLTLDNSGGEIPIDFTEVAITRRAYRDGENEYLINGQRVRLQDVNELLAHTGLGKRTYALVGQGLIDRVLSLAPEERRSLFEEAAGITGYQSKRATTLRRLEATDQNLVRAADIIAELSPRLGYLRRQADRAREREQIAADLHDLLREWYGFRWHSTIRDLEQEQAAETQLQQSVERRRRALASLGEEIARLRSAQTEVRAALGDMHRQSSTYHRQAEAVGRDLAVVHERLRQIQARTEDMQRELTTLELQQSTLQDRVAATERAWNAAVADHERQRLAVDQAQQVLAARQATRAHLQDAVDTARAALARAQAARADVQSRIEQLAEQRTALHSELATQQRAEQELSSEAEAHAAAAQRSQESLARLEIAAQEQQSTIRAAEEQSAELRQQLAAAEQARQAAERAHDRVQTRHDLLRRLRDEGAGFASGVRAVLQAGRKPPAEAGALAGVLGAVADLIQAPSHLDKAIETALGGAIQDIVVATWEDAQQAIEYLKRESRGRATFLPLNRLSVLPAIAAPRLAGVLGNAADLVDCAPGVEPAIRLLLNRVWVTQDLAAARRALDTVGSGPRPTVVTLDGEIVRPGGAVTGGSDRQRSDESILSRARELRSLPEQVATAGRQMQAAADQCARLATTLESVQAKIGEGQVAANELARQIQQQRQQWDAERAQASRVQEALHWRSERMTQISAELRALDERETSLQAALQQLTAEEQENSTRLMQAEAAVEQAGVGDSLQRLADLRAAAAEAHGALRSQEAVLDGQRRSLQETTTQIDDKVARMAALEAELQAQLARSEALAVQEQEISGHIGQLQRQIDPAEQRLLAMETRQAEAEGRERALQQALRNDERDWNTAQLQVQRTQDVLRQMRHDIEHDLGLVLFEETEERAYQPPLPWDTIVEQLPVVAEAPPGLEEEVQDMRARLSRVSNVNPDAPREYEEAAGRHEFLLSQSADLEAAAADLRKVIRELDEIMRVELHRTFTAVAEQFEHFFQVLFNGGGAKLVLTDPDDVANSGIEIIARPPGKRPQSLALLSGGERTLSACALIFAILRVSPTPFCVMDEVDAALDEANIDRFRQTLGELSAGTQFIIVTHNRRTLEGASAIYGVTMSGDGVSRVISLRLDGDQIVQQDGQRSEDVAVIEDLVGM